MNPQVQTVLALGIVAVATLGLIWRVMSRRRGGGGHDGCGMVSRDAKEFRRRLRRS